MNEAEVKKKFGERFFLFFLGWMRGQTVGVGKDGEVDYYSHDVEDWLAQAENQLWKGKFRVTD